MITVPSRLFPALLLALASTFSPASAEPTGRQQLAAQPGGKQVICDEIEQRFIVQQSQLNSRVLNFLLFDAAERGCLELARRFLDLGASVKARDRAGNTALLIAARMGETKVVELLLERGSAIDHKNLAGSTAVLRAVTMNRRRTTKFLLSAGADPSLANKRGVTPVAAAAFNGNVRLLKLLLEAGAEHQTIDVTGKSAMVYGAAKGFADVVTLLLAAGVEVDARYGNDLTALMWAAGHSNDVPVDDGLETVRVLLDKGARLDLADNRGRTALMTAAERGHAEIVALLLDAGADPQARDRGGLTARDLAGAEAVRTLLVSD